MVGTTWKTDDIWLRRHFRIEKPDAALAGLRIHHDEDAEVYLNGKKVAEFGGFVQSYFTVMNEAVRQALREGDNVLAVHCHQTVGGQFIDVGIEAGVDAKR